METVEVEKEVFEAIVNRMDFLHKTVTALFEKLRERGMSDWLTTEQACEYLHISERKLRSLKERGKIGFAHIGRISQFKGKDLYELIITENGGA